MLALHQKSNPKEIIVGWYATGKDITYASHYIHDFFAKEAKRAPIHLLLDTEFSSGEMGVKAFTSTPVVLAKKLFSSRFDEIHCEVDALDTESMALASFIRPSAKEAVSSVVSDLDNLKQTIVKLRGHITDVKNYVNKVLSGETKPNKQIGRMLTKIVSSLPKIEESTFGKMFNDNLQDLLMVVYLSNLTRTQLEIAEKLQALT
eukprot:TRINITY_DN3200_c0_g1_i4.p1 TRINITY_DN3200_c0_g1~~TRINITY_DN3200_c0_g1_i4.p1  ORF type:complete len:204 (-),score=12.19 TRINITY_DN3200_c0_g1_i4:54-665(-)